MVNALTCHNCSHSDANAQLASLVKHATNWTHAQLNHAAMAYASQWHQAVQFQMYACAVVADRSARHVINKALK